MFHELYKATVLWFDNFDYLALSAKSVGLRLILIRARKLGLPAGFIAFTATLEHHIEIKVDRTHVIDRFRSGTQIVQKCTDTDNVYCTNIREQLFFI